MVDSQESGEVLDRASASEDEVRNPLACWDAVVNLTLLLKRFIPTVNH